MLRARFLRCCVCVLLLSVNVCWADRTSEVAEDSAITDSSTNRMQYSATTAVPQIDSALDDDAEAGTIDDFEDTVPDDVPADAVPSGLESAAVGLGKAVDLFETLSTVWRTVNAAKTNGLYTIAVNCKTMSNT